ncbi:hypothetical protein V6N13_047252 [Hibiscus sabdariffa]
MEVAALVWGPYLLLGAWHLYKVLEKRKSIKLKQNYFKRNGGLLLQQQVSDDEANVEKVKILCRKSWKRPPITLMRIESLVEVVKELFTREC